MSAIVRGSCAAAHFALATAFVLTTPVVVLALHLPATFAAFTTTALAMLRRHLATATAHLALVELTVIVGVHQRKTLGVLAFDLGDGHLAVAIRIEMLCGALGAALCHALGCEILQFGIGERAVAIGIGSLEAIKLNAGELFSGDDTIAIGIKAGETAHLLAALHLLPGSLGVALTILRSFLGDGGGTGNQAESQSRQQDLVFHVFILVKGRRLGGAAGNEVKLTDPTLRQPCRGITNS
ncbi:protein of unknown function [Nitratireductor aquimarinus]